MPHSIDIGNYEKVPTVDEQWHPNISSSSSSIDNEDITLMSDGKKKPWPEHDIKWIRSPFMFLLDFFLLALVLILTIRRPPLESAANLAGLQGDVLGLVPRFDEEIVTFQAHPEFISNHSSEESLKKAREHWIKLLPPGQGFVKVDEVLVKEYNLPKAIEYKGGKSVGTSMMHGLHCLYMIMSEYDMLRLGVRQPPIDTWHFDHCIDYVRQLLLCGGDMALAGEDLPNGSTFLNVPHVCKNFDQVYDWLYEHRDNDAYQFGSHETHFVPP